MCYICRQPGDRAAIAKERTAKEWISMAGQARDAGMLYLLLTGGEVFLRKDFMEIYSELSKMGFHIEIYTNATMIDRDIAKKLAQIPPSKVGVTLYGASRETYRKVCGNADGYDHAMRGVELLQSEGITLWLKTTVIRSNVYDFDMIKEYADDRGIYFGFIDYVSPRREAGATCPENERLSPAELYEFLEHAKDFYAKKSFRRNSDEEDECGLNSTYESDLVKKIKSGNTASISAPNDAFKCTAGKCSYWITWDGRMTPCTFMDEPFTYPFETGFNKAWTDLQTFCEAVPVCKECMECSVKDECSPCPAKLKIETGHYNKPAPYLCSLMLNKYKEEVLLR
jgi:MoaA/NifB/PqqE/SkfB family radical SAM enzyme